MERSESIGGMGPVGLEPLLMPSLDVLLCDAIPGLPLGGGSGTLSIGHFSSKAVVALDMLFSSEGLGLCLLF